MTWWEKLFSGFNKTEEKEEVDVRKGEKVSPELIEWFNEEGFFWDEQRGWWYRVWTTAVPYRRYPYFLERFETYQLDPNTKLWKYRIINPDALGAVGGGGNGQGWLIWEDDLGERE